MSPRQRFRAGVGWLIAAGVIACALHPLLYWGQYAGDAQIHLVYGENAGEGRYFEFNPGEKSAGVTSPGYMLLVGALFRGVDPSAVPLIIKLLDILFWYGSLVATFFLARSLLGDASWALAAALVAGLVPGSTYNATIGMENGLFALLVVSCVALLVRWEWLATDPPPLLTRSVAIGLLLGLACWVRPEGIVIAALVYAECALRIFGERRALAPLLRRLLPSLLMLAVAVGLLLYFHFDQTGELLPSSARARVIRGQDLPLIGNLGVSFKPFIRAAAYAPLTILWIVGVIGLFRSVRARSAPTGMRLPVAVAVVFFGLYSTVLGAAHLSRYVIFVMPFVIVVALFGLRRSWSSWSIRLPRNATVAILAIGLLAVFVSEAAYRRGELGSSRALEDVRAAPGNRAARSAALINELGGHDQPVSIALQEVQIRYYLDERFVVRSLDGRTDPLLLGFVENGQFDHVGYLEARGVHYLLATPDYNHEPDQWSLASLRSLGPNGIARRDGLVFRRLGDGEIFAIAPVSADTP